MKRTHWAMCFWPGLPQLWQSGSWSALLVAIAFSVLLNLLIVSTLIWNELISSPLRIVIAVTILVSWLLSLAVSIGWLRKFASLTSACAAVPVGDLFSEALDQYLAKNWFAAESLLGQILAKDGQDVEARLMLATLKRHTGQWHEARRELQRLGRQEHAEKWQHEISHELRKIDLQIQENAQNDPNDQTEDNNYNDDSTSNQADSLGESTTQQQLSENTTDDQQNEQTSAA